MTFTINPTDNSTITEETITIDGAIAQFRFLEGKVLTIIDASTEDVRKASAMKDLVKGAFRQQMNHVSGANNFSGQCDASRPAVSAPESV